MQSAYQAARNGSILALTAAMFSLLLRLIVRARTWAVLACLLCLAAQAQAETVTLSVVASFAGTNGAYPWASLAQGTDGNFYGTTYSGGASTNVDPHGGWVGYGS